MPRLTNQEVEENLRTLFEPTENPAEERTQTKAALAFLRLVSDLISRGYPWLEPHVKLDAVRVAIFIKRFYRDAFGIKQFFKLLDEEEISGNLHKSTHKKINDAFEDFLSVRINSAAPKKTRVVAAFSLWMSTIRPVCIINPKPDFLDGIWHLEPNLNFILAKNYLSRYGTVSLGDPVKDLLDSEDRWWRIWYDFTYRAISLSSLEFMYAGIFRPKDLSTRKPDQKRIQGY